MDLMKRWSMIARQFGIEEYPSWSSWGTWLLTIETEAVDNLRISDSSGVLYDGSSRGCDEAYT